jgi:hypothetical protein
MKRREGNPQVRIKTYAVILRLMARCRVQRFDRMGEVPTLAVLFLVRCTGHAGGRVQHSNCEIVLAFQPKIGPTGTYLEPIERWP